MHMHVNALYVLNYHGSAFTFIPGAPVLSRSWASADRDVDIKADIVRNTSLPLWWWPRHL